MKHVIENRHLRYFLEVARGLHMTRAAERLHIAQPALTQNIKYLEDELGVQLLIRQGKRLSLTQAGIIFAQEAKNSLAHFQRTLQAAQSATRGEKGKIAIGFQGAAGVSIIPLLLKRLRAKYPDIEVILHEMGTSAQRQALRQHEIDVAMMYSLLESEFSCQKLTPEALVVALHEGHQLARRQSIALEDLREETFILPTFEVVEALYHAVIAECAEAGFQPKHIQEVSAAQTALGLVSAGHGIAILPASIQILKRKGAVIRPLRHSRLQVTLNILWPRECPSPIIPKILECMY